MSKPGTEFRPDINGLRAWAVAAVVLYHFRVPGFSGGFVGVDVFFVISGFLMTGIVINGLDSKRGFSFLQFYLARARRILPALLILCIVLMLLGWWSLLPLDYKMLGTHAAFSLTFLSNIKFWLEASYFDVASHDKWLLHTWSLAAEWQFYLLLPVFLSLIWKIWPERKSLLAGLIVLGITSLLLCVVLTPIKPTAAFYLLPTRAWEMLAGGATWLVAAKLVSSSRSRALLEISGFGLIISSVMIFDASVGWPGWRAVVPVIGAVFITLAARTKSLLTGLTVIQWIGTRSYSLYLWHWPIVVALQYSGLQNNAIAVIAGVVLTLVLGDLSYRWVEMPSRLTLSIFKPHAASAALVVAIIFVSSIGVFVRAQNGFLSRVSSDTLIASREAENGNPRRGECHAFSGGKSPSCIFGGNHVSAILIGDSHANAVVSALAAAVPRAEDGVMEWTYSGCPTIKGVHSQRMPENQCNEFVDWAIAKLATEPSDVPVVIVNRHAQYAIGKNEDIGDTNRPWVYFSKPYKTSEPAFLQEYARQIIDTTCLLARDRLVYLVRPIPEMSVDVPKTMSRKVLWGRVHEVSVSLAEYHQRQGFVWAAQDEARDRCGAKILDPLPYLCSDGRCHGAKNGRPIYYDDDHLSEFGNRLLVPMFEEVFKKTATSSDPTR